MTLQKEMMLMAPLGTTSRTKEMMLIRHGESRYNAYLTDHLDSELTPKGINQARATGKFIHKNFPNISDFSAITSPYLRCLQTSSIIKEETGLNFIVKPEPREIMMSHDFCEVLNHSEKFPYFQWNHNESLIFQQETSEQFIARMEQFVREIKEYHEKVLIISHGSPINTMYELSLGLKGKADMINYVKNCGICYIRDNESVYFGKTIYEE